MNVVDLDRYLERIDYRGPLAVDAATLAALQEAHLLHVPFENLDIHWGVPITLDVARHYAKIVGSRRGGFCYEQNALFAWALETLGFRVTRLGAGVFGVRDGVADFSVETSHMLLKVDLDRPWIADVGFGENFRRPLRLVDGAIDDQGSRAYRLDRDRIDDVDCWTLSTREPDGHLASRLSLHGHRASHRVVRRAVHLSADVAAQPLHAEAAMLDGHAHWPHHAVGSRMDSDAARRHEDHHADRR